MKLLAVDIGNSEIKQAVIENGVVGDVVRTSTTEIDEVARQLVSAKIPIALCSVRSKASAKIREVLAQNKRPPAFEIDSRIEEPISGFYEGIGADRVAEISAAWSEFDGKRPVAVIGLGTATTITSASRAGVFKGGFITLGLGSTCATLTEALPELPAVDPRQARSLEPGFDVYSSICRGTVIAHLGIIDEWVKVFRRQLGDDLAVVATGGWSQLLAPWCYCFEKVDPHLTLRGIWTIFNSVQRVN